MLKKILVELFKFNILLKISSANKFLNSSSVNKYVLYFLYKLYLEFCKSYIYN